LPVFVPVFISSVFKKTDNRKRCYRKHFSIVQNHKTKRIGLFKIFMYKRTCIVIYKYKPF